MSDKNDGGPAFPLTEDALAFRNKAFAMQGMSLRDWFAGQALANPKIAEGDNVGGESCWCYEWADAMIAARKAVGNG